MKIHINGRRVENTGEIQGEPQAMLNSVKKREFQRRFRQWQTFLVRRINSERVIFEEDKTDL
jgi:hypothetical protein